MDSSIKIDKVFSTSEARKKLGDIVNEVYYQKKIYEVKKGKSIAVLIVPVNEIIDDEGVWSDEITERIEEAKNEENLLDAEEIIKK